jgi:hypothetical protein
MGLASGEPKRGSSVAWCPVTIIETMDGRHTAPNLVLLTIGRQLQRLSGEVDKG